MSLIEQAFRAKVLANGAVVALVADRVYGQRLPQRPTYPAISVVKISAPRDHVMEGQSGFVQARFQVDCWSPDDQAAKTLADTVRLAMGGLPATVLGVEINAISLEDDRDLYDDDLEVYGASVDYLVIYNEAKPA